MLHEFLWGNLLNLSGGCSWFVSFTSWNVLCRTWGCCVFTLSDYPVLKSSYLLEEFTVCVNVCASTCSSSECRLHLFRTFTNINISYCSICCSISFTRTANFTVDRVEFSVGVSHCSKIADSGVLWFRTRFRMFHNLRMGGLWISASLSGESLQLL